jgi:hypothetical protein
MQIFNSSVFILTILLLVLTTLPAYAYIKSGSGSMLLQAIMAMGLGIVMFFRQMKLLLVRLFTKKKTDE